MTVKPFVGYKIPIACKGVVIEDGKIWLRKNERDEWEFPGGKLDKGEQPWETVEREVLEELGVKVTVGRLLHAGVSVIPGSMDEYDGVLGLAYACEFVERVGELELESEGGVKPEFRQFEFEEALNLHMLDFYKRVINILIKED
jgi:8-oxo-dGTP pyrophosphatase MutT (NUDIX family)